MRQVFMDSALAATTFVFTPEATAQVCRAGVLMGKRFSLTGTVQFPIGIDGGFNTYTVSTTVGLGHVRP